MIFPVQTRWSSTDSLWDFLSFTSENGFDSSHKIVKTSLNCIYSNGLDELKYNTLIVKNLTYCEIHVMMAAFSWTH